MPAAIRRTNARENKQLYRTPLVLRAHVRLSQLIIYIPPRFQRYRVLSLSLSIAR